MITVFVVVFISFCTLRKILKKKTCLVNVKCIFLNNYRTVFLTVFHSCYLSMHSETLHEVTNSEYSELYLVHTQDICGNLLNHICAVISFIHFLKNKLICETDTIIKIKLYII